MIELTEEHLRNLLARAWNAGFYESGEGYNGEYVNKNSISRVDKAKCRDILAIMMTLWTAAPEDS
jgi:hypothetical protein